jgi:hypothetical protein
LNSPQPNLHLNFFFIALNSAWIIWKECSWSPPNGARFLVELFGSCDMLLWDDVAPDLALVNHSRYRTVAIIVLVVADHSPNCLQKNPAFSFTNTRYKYF